MSPAPTSDPPRPLCSWARRPRQADASGVSEEFSGEGAALLAVARRRVLLTGLSSAGSDGASPGCGSAVSSEVVAAFFSAFLPDFLPDFLSALSLFFSLVLFADFLSAAFLDRGLTGLSSAGESEASCPPTDSTSSAAPAASWTLLLTPATSTAP